MSDQVELLFFDTFAHDNTEEINLDLVQFPKPVYVTEVRIIPLGARVQADFPGGVRLGATNPSQFQIEFFVNDLGKPGASTFETLGGFEYDQNGCINLDCVPDETLRKIPTDGLVLRGLYTTITLAVYGRLTNNITEQIIQPVVNPGQQPNTIADAQQISSIETEWPQEIPSVPIEYTSQTPAAYHGNYAQSEGYPAEFTEYYNDVPKDPRGYHHGGSESEWENKPRREPERQSERPREITRDKERRYSRSHSRDRERQPREYREISRERERERDWERDRDHDWHGYKHEDNYRRYSREEREERKRPRTPPPQSPKRPHTPHSDHKDATPPKEVPVEPPEITREKTKSPVVEVPVVSPVVNEEPQMELEEFEPILSDEDMDEEHYQDLDYDYSSYTNNDDIIKLFIPGVTPLKKFEDPPSFRCEDQLVIDEALQGTIGIIDDYFKSSITRYTQGGFEGLNKEIKEEFVHLCEKVISTIGPSEVFCDISKIYLAAKHKNLPKTPDLEQVDFIMENIVDWLKISLSYALANNQEQPAYKIRHIKSGVRLAEYCSNSLDFLEVLWETPYNLHETLLELFDKPQMAPSIKLMMLRALDGYLMHKPSVYRFVFSGEAPRENGYNDGAPSPRNGYRVLVELIRKDQLVRPRYALSTMLKRLNLFEVLSKMHGSVSKLRCDELTVEELGLLVMALEQLAGFCQRGSFSLSSPKRFLPVASQYEIVRSDCKNAVLVESLRMFDLVQCFLLLLCTTSTSIPVIRTPIFEILASLLETTEGLGYLADNSPTVNVLLKCLLRRVDEEIPYDVQMEMLEGKSHRLGLTLAYKLQALYHVNALKSLGNKPVDLDSNEVLDQLHALYCLSFSSIGKVCVGQVLGLPDNIQALLGLFHPRDAQFKLKKSTGLAYIIDLLHITIGNVSNIPVLEKHSRQLLGFIAGFQEVQDESIVGKLEDLRSYCLPFDGVVLNYANIAPFLSLVERHSENVTTTSFPGVLVTSLRILQHLGISRFTGKSSIVQMDDPLSNYNELKYKYVILQLFSLDGHAILTKLLMKICEFYDQPTLHSSTFVSNAGLGIVNVIQPCIRLVKQMLANVVQCQNTNFKDLTTIPVFLQTYNLLNSFPLSAPSYCTAQEIQTEIIECLLVYTQPVSEEMHEKDSLNKTLWTQMAGEVLKYTTSAPYRFISGLLVFSELLPLPLPIQTREDLSEAQVTWMLNLRKLWSAHLHPHSGAIQELVNNLCISTQPQLLNLLRRVCVQLADLAANSAVMVARGILDSVYEVLVMKDEAKPAVCSAHMARLLNFLACLVTHNTIKCAVLHLIHSHASLTAKPEEKYNPGLIHAFSQVLKLNNGSTSHIQSQECILSIIQSFCDTEITLMQNPVEGPELSSEMYLANSMPTKEHLTSFVSMIIEHLSGDNSFVTYLPIVRTLLLLTEHDYGFYHLREALIRRGDPFVVLLNKLAANFSKNSAEYLSTLSTLIEFLRVSLTVEDADGSLSYTPRTIKISPGEMLGLVGWHAGDEKHPLKNLEAVLKGVVEEDNSFDTLLESLTTILKVLDKHDASPQEATYTEVQLPAPETLLMQFAKRTVFSSSDACDERLTSRYWLALPTDEGDNDLENLSCDLLEICRQNLPEDYNLIKEVEKLCRISRLESPEDKEKRGVDDQKAKMKKPFVPPLRARGFPRTVQQRPDLFRSRPPNTSRPPSLHVDDFVALETCGAQPTGPTGYNKISRELLASGRMARGSRGRAFVACERSVQYRQMSWWGAGMGRGPYQL